MNKISALNGHPQFTVGFLTASRSTSVPTTGDAAVRRRGRIATSVPASGGPDIFAALTDFITDATRGQYWRRPARPELRPARLHTRPQCPDRRRVVAVVAALGISLSPAPPPAPQQEPGEAAGRPGRPDRASTRLTDQTPTSPSGTTPKRRRSRPRRWAPTSGTAALDAAAPPGHGRARRAIAEGQHHLASAEAPRLPADPAPGRAGSGGTACR
jgi:hypothetical protein